MYARVLDIHALHNHLIFINARAIVRNEIDSFVGDKAARIT